MISKQAQMIKTAIEMELTKEGKTLSDLELALSSQLTEKSAGMSLVDWFKGLDIIKSLGSLGGGSAVVGGGLVGAGAYSGYLANEDSTNQQMKRMKEIKQYQDATKTLQEDVNNPITL